MWYLGIGDSKAPGTTVLAGAFHFRGKCLLTGNMVYLVYKFYRTSWQPDLKPGNNGISIENVMLCQQKCALQ
jgi:hypothetical protein